ncbi:MAG: C40 family peptidase [Candidatus Marinimicrobia bacterium]|nr:C40 family peptidase [Candidatus Neomarinimicrobiota bacterium]
MSESRIRSAMVVNTSVANVYAEPSFASEIVTQAILGETPAVLDQRGKWFQLEQWDGYRGWVYHFSLAKNPQFLVKGEWILVNVPTAPIREEPNDTAPPFRDAVFGVRLPLLGRQEPWVQVALPDGLSGWLQNEPLALTGTRRDQVVQIARRFLGVPYMWGGKTPKGFDCSGFVQTCFKAVGVHLPRDSYQQNEFGDLPAVMINDAQPGDLLFFGDQGQRIAHVAISLGSGEIIHAAGWVRTDSLEAANTRYNQPLRGSFTIGRDVTGLINA